MKATAKWSGPGSGHSETSSRLKSAPQCWEPDPRYPSWPAVMKPRSKAEYMTAPVQPPKPPKPLAQRGPSIHDVEPLRSSRAACHAGDGAHAGMGPGASHRTDGGLGPVQSQPVAEEHSAAAVTPAIRPVLADPDTFNRVFVRLGAVYWPGDLDIARDAIYATIKASDRLECVLS